MDRKKLDFLEQVAGPDGAAALAKASDLGPDLEWAIFPRAVLSWLMAVTVGSGYDGNVPSTTSRLVLQKHEAGYSGVVQIDGEDYTFASQPLSHVAGSVAIAVAGISEPAPGFVSPALAKLGKSIDLLVRARTLRKFGPEPPDPTAPPTNKKSPGGAAGGAKVKVTKSSAQADCPTCGGGARFQGGKFAGCACFRDLTKHAVCVETPDYYELTLDRHWDSDAVRCLEECFDVR
jgi:hypothetical protein